jgi:hypothetical protein
VAVLFDQGAIAIGAKGGSSSFSGLNETACPATEIGTAIQPDSRGANCPVSLGFYVGGSACPLQILLHRVDPSGQPMLGPPREASETEAFLRSAYRFGCNMTRS